jgi:transposase
VLLAAENRQDKEVAAMMEITPKKVARWRQRFLTMGLAGLEKDAPRPGRTPKIGASFIRRVVSMTTRQKPPNATHWSTRTMAAAAGISEASVRRIWRHHGLKPHRVESFKISNDPAFAEKLEDIVGLYLNPPEHALVLCVDEKSQIQALDRTQPGLPLKRGRSQTLTHDYKRNGTATLFAALNAANGEVYGFCQERHRHQEWLKFLRLLDYAMPAHLELHLIGDNYATHKHPKVQRWLARHRAFRCTSRPPVRRGSTWWNAFFAISPRTGCGAVSFAISKNSSWPLELTSTATTKTPSPSSGRPAPPISWKRSRALAAPCIKVDLHDALH